MNSNFDFVLFEHEPSGVSRATAAGINSFIVDCEWRGKEERQKSADTEILPTFVQSVKIASEIAGARIYCRINRFGPWTAAEVEDAVTFGAQRIFLPMVQTPDELEQYLRYVDRRVESAILIETDQAVQCMETLARLPLDAVYVGLNDLAISRGTCSIFSAIADGTVERIREAFPSVCFGFGGITVVDKGSPVPCKMFMKEMARLGSSFGFLRRSFRKDVTGRNMETEMWKLQELWIELLNRSDSEILADHHSLHRLIREKGLD